MSDRRNVAEQRGITTLLERTGEISVVAQRLLIAARLIYSTGLDNK